MNDGQLPGDNAHTETLALIDALRAKGVRRVELNANGGIQAVEFGDAPSDATETKPEDERPDPATAAHEAAIVQVQRGAFSRKGAS